MSDRVAFIGGSGRYDFIAVATPTANQVVGQDHFPFPIVNAPASPSTKTAGDPPYDNGVTLANAAKWALRVKQWAVDGTVTWTGGSGARSHTIDFSSLATTVSMGKLFDTGVGTLGTDVMVREAETSIFAGVLNDPFIATFSDGSGSFDASFLSMLTVTNIPPILSNSGLFYPKFGAGFLTAGISSFSWDDNIEIATGEGLDFDVVIDSGAIVVDGTASYEMYLSAAGEDVDVSSVSIDLLLTPIEFWPYAARDGTPIYNTSDGSQLQSPFN